MLKLLKYEWKACARICLPDVRGGAAVGRGQPPDHD